MIKGKDSRSTYIESRSASQAFNKIINLLRLSRHQKDNTISLLADDCRAQLVGFLAETFLLGFWAEHFHQNGVFGDEGFAFSQINHFMHRNKTLEKRDNMLDDMVWANQRYRDT